MRKSLTKILVAAAFLACAALTACQSAPSPTTQSATQTDQRDIGNGAYGESVP